MERVIPLIAFWTEGCAELVAEDGEALRKLRAIKLPKVEGQASFVLVALTRLPVGVHMRVCGEEIDDDNAYLAIGTFAGDYETIGDALDNEAVYAFYRGEGCYE